MVVLRRRILCKPYFEYVRDYVCSQALSSLSPGPASVIFLPMQNFLAGILCCSGIFSRPYGNSPILTIRLQGCCVISPVRWHVSSPVPPLNADVPQHTSLSFCILNGLFLPTWCNFFGSLLEVSSSSSPLKVASFSGSPFKTPLPTSREHSVDQFDGNIGLISPFLCYPLFT